MGICTNCMGYKKGEPKVSKLKVVILIAVVLVALTLKLSPPLFEEKLRQVNNRFQKDDIGEDNTIFLLWAEKFSRLDFLSDINETIKMNGSHYFTYSYYKFPPLISMLLTPIYIFDIEPTLWTIYIQEILGILIVIPLFLLCKNYLTFRTSLLVSVVPSFTPAYFSGYIWSNGVGLGYAFYLLLFSILILSIFRQRYIVTSIFLSLLFLTHYITVYLLLFVAIFFLYKYRNRYKLMLMSFGKVLLFPCVALGVWLTRNGYLYGFTLRGLFGSYFCFFEKSFIRFQLIDDKLISIITLQGADYRVVCTTSILLIYLVSLFLIRYIKTQEIKILFKSFGLFVILFFLLTAFMYDDMTYNYKFLFTFSPLLVFFSLFLSFLTLNTNKVGIKEKVSKWKTYIHQNL